MFASIEFVVCVISESSRNTTKSENEEENNKDYGKSELTPKLERWKNTWSFRINENGVNQTGDPDRNENNPLIKKERSTKTKIGRDIKEKNL